jgi:hypothetical protein
MASDQYERSVIALAALELFPPLISESVISDHFFRKKYRLTADAQISFDSSGVSIQRSKLFKCIREVFTDSNSRHTLKDTAKEEWQLELIEKDNERRIVLSQGGRRLFLPDFSVFSSDQNERLVRFDLEAVEVNLPSQVLTHWREILSSRPLADDELDMLNTEIKETPIRVSALVRSELEDGTSSFSSLVPRSVQYFDRLVGECQQSLSIAEYAPVGAAEHIKQLISWRPYDGLLLALLLSSHSLNSNEICIDQFKDDDLIQAYEWLQKHGDRVSQVGAVEIGLSVLDKRPEIEPYIKNIIEQLRDDNTDDDRGRLRLLSALIVLVEGELSRTKILREKPPFWRRLASIAQASLIEREIIRVGIDFADFSKWAMQSRGLQFYIQTMCDLRREPRWHPDFVSSNQLKAEFIGRIANAAQLYAPKLETSTLHDLLLKDGPQSIRSQLKFPYPFLPGPLEGAVESQNVPPEEVVREIEEQLNKEVLQPESFIALVNSALIFRIDSQHAQLATKALRSAKHQIKQTTDKELLSSVLRGIATVAAVTRSVDLSDELKILIRRCRLEPGRGISVEDALWIGLIAAAAHSELTPWCQFVGDWITELAFQSLQQDDFEKLHSHLEQLCHIVPDLWHTCGRAEAALTAAVDS